ncbi:hypothetical protein [Mycolicibacterium llatzerense]|uniref:hypothetical protein n=1 Tax=Mycolicibacterium llatzerense TaxID=280871 RepID=UPI000AE8B3B4|nr:hypothetical protein [Mycolicibacterium llatzerense]
MNHAFAKRPGRLAANVENGLPEEAKGLKHGIVIAGEAGCAGLIDETLLFRRYRDGPRGRRPGTDPECSPGHEHRARYPHDKST